MAIGSVAFALCPVSGAVSAVPFPLTATCVFEEPALLTDADGVTCVSVSGCVSGQVPGLPVLPFRTLRLALPSGFTANGVLAHLPSPAVPIPGAWQIEYGLDPMASATPVKAQAGTPGSVGLATYPPVKAELVSVQRLAGYDIAIVRVLPLQYTPALGRLDFTAIVTVEVILAPSANGAIPPSPRRSERQRVLAAVDNPESFSSDSRMLSSALGDPTTNYLLITRAALLPAFQPLIAQKQAAGLTVITETMETITNLYAGVDAAERLRTYIRYAYTNWGVQYVLLGGDIKVVPYRGVYARCSGVTLNLMPSDLYFACLDGSWNHDGDALWGEPTDGETGGDVDLLTEVCVGRAPVETAAEVSNFVARCLAAEQTPSARFRACFAGEYLSAAGAQGGSALDSLQPAFSNSFCPVAWLDDRPYATTVWTAADALDALNRSPLLVAHFGHGTEYGYDTTALRLTVSDLDALTNASPFLLYSTACNTGAFDNNFGLGDCIAEELVKRNAHGAFTVLANAREGWYDPRDEQRYSGEFQQRFFDRLLSDERVPVGLAHELAKQDLLGSVETSGSSMPYRWCLFGINLFGDPQAAVRVPLSLRFRVTPAERIVTWNSWPNRTYSVYRATDLTAGLGACISSNLFATPPLNVYTDSVPNPISAFYRIIAQ
jgi:hypothetical protein